MDQPGRGPIVAASVLRAWADPGPLNSEPAVATRAGAAPLPATSGRAANRPRLNRSGDRQLNRALHTIAPCSAHRTVVGPRGPSRSWRPPPCPPPAGPAPRCPATAAARPRPR
ncbi:transposase, partial [Isoptericola haloaureus]|uniref:transposase n=1 Tax=Isoptericola haloaureus TaxID=1542902 RepID=UPI003860188E